jgi:hypothetical protein
MTWRAPFISPYRADLSLFVAPVGFRGELDEREVAVNERIHAVVPRARDWWIVLATSSNQLYTLVLSQMASYDALGPMDSVRHAIKRVLNPRF